MIAVPTVMIVSALFHYVAPANSTADDSCHGLDLYLLCRNVREEE